MSVNTGVDARRFASATSLVLWRERSDLKPELGWGCIIGFAAAALLLGAGLSGLRSPEDEPEKPAVS